MSIRIIKPGMLTTVQSGPRRGLRHLGVPAAGAADPLSLALANKLVGNDVEAAALEATLVGPRLRFEQPTRFALTGAVAEATLNDDAVAYHETREAGAGDELFVGPAAEGCRVYIAFAGGIAAQPVLGSSSTYLPAALGGHRGRALREGDLLYLGADAPQVRLATPDDCRPPITTRWALRVCRSVETSALAPGQRGVLFDTHWRIGRRADRMGMALDGARLGVVTDGRMPSAAVFPGTIQCPDSGVPFLLSVDAQTTGGYPRVAQVARADRHLIGQMRPGDRVLLLPRQPEEAVDELRAKIRFWSRWLPDAARVFH
ncbi:MAG: biotin-dependent carboxyltransferase family protein [Woeseiaceae bacterium]|nr:biotin-dependent carboxyltransferase family protein [Woeseiaceae bacterium]